ncbi:MAG: hypothetical protein J5891_04340 [Spirochaetales bacterium]|nr:hypothetical protein [Spirochaetales bacterium]
MRVRVVEDVFNGNCSEFELEGSYTADELRKLLQVPDAQVLQNGKILDPEVILEDDGIVVVRVVPGEFATVVAIIGLVVGIAGLVIGVVALCSIKTPPDIKKVQTNPSLRGSTNNARMGGRLPILLGRHRVYPDVAALPFSSYSDNDQYFHQLFCFGYSDVSIDMNTLKIGESLISNYTGYEVYQGLGSIYPSRVIEASYCLELRNNGTATPIVRSTSSNTYLIQVGIMAPNGIYRYDEEDKTTESISFRIEWRVPDGQWNLAAEVTKTLNTDKYREMFTITPSGSSEGRYEVRVTRTDTQSDSSTSCDSIYLDCIKSFTKNMATNDVSPVADPSAYRLLAVKLKATDQLNGVIDDINAICTLRTRTWDGQGSGSTHWTVDATRNPASAILYLLTDSKVNPCPVDDTMIDWESFEEFFEWCDDNGFTCDTVITGEYTNRQLCEFIASSNLAELRVQCDIISIRIDRAQTGVVQLFTPRNAWDFEMERSFEDQPTDLVVKFNDASSGYVEAERIVSAGSDGTVSFDTAGDGEQQEVEAFGVTSADHAGRLGLLRLKELRSRSRSFNWKSDIEGIVCLPGDVVMIENDNFLLGLGEGRIKKIFTTSTGIKGVLLDTKFRMEAGGSYGMTIRTNTGMISSVSVVTKAGRFFRVDFTTELPLNSGIDIGDLCSYGYFSMETHKVLVTSMTPDVHRQCSFTAVDYSEDIYSDEMEIPEWVSGISEYPDDGVNPGIRISNAQERTASPLNRSPKYLGVRSSLPSIGIAEGDYLLYSGSASGYQYGHLYKWSSGTWAETTGLAELATAVIDAQALPAPAGASSDWKCFAAEEYKRRCTLSRLNMENELSSSNGTSLQESFQFKASQGKLNDAGTAWEEPPEFYIRSGSRLLMGMRGDFIDTLDGNTKKRALVNGAGTFAVTDTGVYAENMVANGISADNCSLHGNIAAEIFINPALIAQPSARGVSSISNSFTQDNATALRLCLWARDNSVPFDTLIRVEVGAESQVGWAMFHSVRSLSGISMDSWNSGASIECYVFFYKDNGDFIYMLKSLCEQRSYEEQNTWIFGWPWFGTHTVYYWAREGGLYGAKNAYTGDTARGLTTLSAPIQSVNPSDYAITYTGYGSYRNNTSGVLTGFQNSSGGTVYFMIWRGSNYDLFFPQLPDGEQNASSKQVYRGANNVLYCKP